MSARVACPEHYHHRVATMKRSTIRSRHPTRSGKEFLESLIDPIDWLSETIFSILILLLYIFAFRIIMLSGAPQVPVSHQNVNELLLGALGAVLAWGMIDGIMYALTSVFERGERHRLLRDIQAAKTEQEAVDIIAEDMDYLLEPIAGEDVRKELYSSILIHLQNSAPRNIGLKREDISGVLGHVLVAIIAVIPSVIPFFVFRYDYELAIRISIFVSFIMLFVSGYRWGKYAGANPWNTGLLIMSVAVILVLIAFLLEG
jgi:VIT1/CCC1 family predicted Fe2+/Mn2+ transporter